MKELIELAKCPIGLFMSGDELCLKTEYGNNEGRIDAYIVSSGEFFWGNQPQSIASQRASLVEPISATAIETLTARVAELKREVEILRPQVKQADDQWDGAVDRIAELEAENARLKKALLPEWFYHGDDTSSDACRDSVYEVIDEDFMWNGDAPGKHIVQISTAMQGPTIWAVVHCFSKEEKDARDDDEAYTVVEYATEEAARAALGEP